MFDTMVVGIPADLEEMAPGADLAALLAALDYEHLSPFDLVRVLRAQQRQVSHYQAGSYWAMNEIVTAYQDGDSDDLGDLNSAVEGAAAEIGAALRLTRRSADIETGIALDVTRRLPAVGEALLGGRIDMRRARVIVDATGHVSVAVARDVADTILGDAALLTTGQLRHRIQKLCIDANPDDAKQRYETALDDRRLVVEANDSGTANLLGMDLPPHVVTAIKRRIHKEAIQLRNAGDTRTMDQLRADIYLDILKRRHTKLNPEPGRDGVVDIQVDLATLAEMNNNSAELNGYGPVGADIARQIAEHQQRSEWRFTLRDPDTGQPIDGGITRRRPTAAQRRKVETLHRTCIHPGCRMPAIDCDLDHRIPWADEKLTQTENLGPFCRHHHTIRHKYGWSYEALPNGDFEFTTPVGHIHTTSGRSP